jgi:hypothetical protein
MVFGILNIGTGSGQRQLLITKTAAGGTYNNGTVNQGVGAIGSFTNTDMRLPTGCDGAGNVSPCEANNVNDVGYAGNLGGGQLGSRLGGNLAPANAASGLIGTALNFFQVSSAGTSTIGNATSTQYANSTGFASWLLNGAGVLTYTVPGEVSVVPLPAAAWLLLSALAGFGAVTRRRQA